MMPTYGVYTPDLKGVALSGQDLKRAKECCWRDHVVCSEKYKTTGFALHIRFSKYWEVRLRPKQGVLNLGFLKIAWERTRMLWADKIVWQKETELTNERN